MTHRQRNSRGRFVSEPSLDVRKENQLVNLNIRISEGPVIYILIYADWCGYCTKYKPLWNSLEKTPGRIAHMASIHHDMVDKLPLLANAQIQGYPSVVKVFPSGKIEEYTIPNSSEKTNAMPTMRDETAMKEELTSAPKNSLIPGTQAGIIGTSGVAEKNILVSPPASPSLIGGGIASLRRSLQRMFGGRRMTFKSPKRSNRRGRTRKHR